MGKIYDILKVGAIRRNQMYYGGRIIYYKVTVNDVPGHDIITLPYFKFSDKPHIGDKIENVALLNGSASMYSVDWVVHKRKTK